MQITVNGKNILLEKEITVRELLESQKVELLDYVTVQVNDELVAREKHKNQIVKEGDVVEFLYFMGGGAL